ncbi:MAG: hypothetical protein QOK48_2346 [Blastocatellia bacterium]|jgi:hypothetical protein|nr:hypothetical protein [Blastocatellia bacterium]
MKHRTIAVFSIATLLLALMVWSFGSSAAGNNGNAAANNSSQQLESNVPQQADEDEFVDADMGKFGSKIDRETYLRLRGEYIGRKRGIEPGRPFDPEWRNRAVEQMDRQEKGRRLESLVNGGLTTMLTPDAAWTPLGPTSITNGQALSGGDTAVSGRVTSIAVDPSNSNNVYLGTAQGGVWRSLDGGTTWEAIFDGALSLAVGALAVAPSDPTKLYVGTGEFNGCADCFFGAGLYRIDNVNTSPTLVGPINPLTTVGNLTYQIFNGRGITKILVHPTDAATVFVSTGRGVGGSGGGALSNTLPPLGTRGVYRSTNATSAAGSVTFQKLVVTPDLTSVDTPATGNLDTPDMVMEPGAPDNILVSVIGASGTFGGIYRTTNATAGTPTFTQVRSMAAGVRANLTINKVGSVVTVYAATSETPSSSNGQTCTTGSGTVRKGVDPFGVGTWSILAGGGGFCGGQCFYDIAVAVNPNNANEIYLGGNAGVRPPSPPNPCPDGMKKSIDGGATFFRDDTGTHADSHALTFDATGGTIFAGNDGGVWKKPASNTVATSWNNLNTAPLNTLQFESIAVHPTDRFMMIGGTQDNGTEFQQTSAGNWSNAEGGDGGYCLIDQSATNTTNVNMYHTFFNQTGTQIGFDRAVNTTCLPIKNFWPTRGIGFVGGGDAEQPSLSCDGTANYLHNGLSLTDNVLFYAPMALGPGSPNTVYFGTDRLYRSTDRGDTMTVVSQASLSNPGGGGSPISSIAIWSGGDNLRLVGLQNGQIWATSTGSSTMVNLAAPFPANPNGSTTKFAGRVAIDPNNKNVGYVALSYFAPAGQGIWKITNLVAASGASPAAPVWAAAANGLPSIPVNALVIDPINSNNLYAGTDIGVYSSTDGGANWVPFGTGLPRSAVFDLQIQPSFRLLRAATHGRGVWETPLISPAASTVQFSTAADALGEAEVSKTVTITRSGDTSFPASINYATGDSSGANNCNVVSGSASSRCDYIATSGTLNFAANETSKNILIPIVDDRYLEGPETFTVTLSAAGGSNVTLGLPSTITLTIIDNETSNGVNPVDTSSFFVREHYIDFLNREPDASGLNFWINNINNCTPQPSCIDVQRINTSAAFFLSIEFQDTGYLVYRIYKAAYGDASGTSTIGGAHSISVPVIRLNEFLPDTQKIGQGVVVGQGNWQQQIDDNKTAFAEEFVQRTRFLTAYPLTLTPAQFVDNLNSQAATPAVTGVKPLSTAERDQLVADLTAGRKTRAQALRVIAEDQTLADAEKNRAFVLMQFFGYLRRNPNDPQDSDYSGYEFWLGKLNQFGGNFVNAEMVKSFILSSEYKQRFGN